MPLDFYGVCYLVQANVYKDSGAVRLLETRTQEEATVWP